MGKYKSNNKRTKAIVLVDKELYENKLMNIFDCLQK